MLSVKRFDHLNLWFAVAENLRNISGTLIDSQGC